ncbi:hypothetical protein CY35_03G120900 [Sphagnum magellanicum]|nr:hypothetical protein CY35_03G120900 [Sphagnum magellanicum]
MKDFKAQRIDTAGVIERVKELFQGHRELILGFNTFLPEGYEITLPAEVVVVQPQQQQQQQQQQQRQQQQSHQLEEKKQPVEFDQAINYVNKIKARFQNDEHVYKAFLEILNMYRKGNKSINEVYHEVAVLFQKHPDLLKEFTCFLPDSTGSAAGVSKVSGHQHHAPPLARSSLPVKPKQEDRPVASGAARNPNVDRVVVHKTEKFASSDRGLDRHGTTTAPGIRIDKERKKGEKERDKKEEVERSRPVRVERNEVNSHVEKKEMELDAMHRFPQKRQSARRADERIRSQSKAEEAGEAAAAPPYARQPGVALASLDELGKGGSSLPAFVEKVKSRLRNRETYQEFLKCLNIFNQEIISRAELQRVVGDLLGKHTDLMEGFNEFLITCENLEGGGGGGGGNLTGVFHNRNSGEFAEEPGLKPKVEKDRERDREKDKEWDKEKERERDGERLQQQQRDKDRVRHFNKPSKEVLHKVSAVPTKDKYINKPLSELDLSNCEQCTPSYRLLPKHYRRPLSSHRNTLADSVLNDSWVSVTSGSEDYSFKHMRKNPYEESLFRCEDDRYELDMLLETTLSTANLIGESIEKKSSDAVKRESPLIEELSAIHLRSIERIYGDHGVDMIELLQKNTVHAIPVIYSRLRQKLEEWMNGKVEMNKVWAEVYSKNSYKALDHRSFYFQQQDKRSLSSKGLVAEIKELNEKKRSEDDSLLASAAGNRRPLLPDLRFEYTDLTVYQDLYQIIEYLCEEACTTREQAEKILRIWTTFLEPMLGVPPRLHGCMDDIQEDLNVGALQLTGSGSSSIISSAGADAEGSETDVLATNAGVTEEGATATSNLVAEVPEGAGAIEDPAAANTQVVHMDTGGAHKNEKPEPAASLEFEGPPGLEKLQNMKPPTENTRYSGNATTISSGVEVRASLQPRGGILGGELEPHQISAEGGAVITQGAAETGAQEADAGEEELQASRLKLEVGPAMKDVEMSEGFEQAEREDGELSSLPELEDRNKASLAGGSRSYQVGRVASEDNDIENFEHDNEDADAAGGLKRRHDAGEDDEGEEHSGHKSSGNSDNLSETGEDGFESESGEELSEHEEEEDEQEEGKKAESEGQAEDVADADDGEGDGQSSLASPDRSFSNCRPLAEYVTSSPEAFSSASCNRAYEQVFYGNDLFYVLFRLHQTLYERILLAKTHAMASEEKWRLTKDAPPPSSYSRFMAILYSLLDGSIDNAKFEEECRALVGTQSYVLFTLDKLIFKLVKQLQVVASDDMAAKLLSLYAYEKAAENYTDEVYHANVSVLLHDESIYRIVSTSKPAELLIQLMEKLEVPANSLEWSFQNYLDDFLLSVPTTTARDTKHPVFLIRNKKYAAAGKNHSDDADRNVMENACVVNGLEYKISCKTYKVSYVLDTEDLFVRRNRRRRSESDLALFERKQSQRHRIFCQWVDKSVVSVDDDSVPISDTSHNAIN